MNVSTYEDWAMGVLPIHLLIEPDAGDSNIIKSTPFFIPEGANLIQIQGIIFPGATHTLKLYQPESDKNRGLRDKWNEVHDNSGHVQFDLTNRMHKQYEKDTYRYVRGWNRFQMGTLSISQAWVTLRVRVPYSYLMERLKAGFTFEESL